jgi:hypothetical protein
MVEILEYFVSIGESIMIINIKWVGNETFLNYGFWKCMFVDFLTTYMGLPKHVLD